MSVMERYHALVRTIVRTAPTKARRPARGASAEPMHYRVLVRLQHRQSLVQMFEPVATRIGPARFERIVDDLRRLRPPTDPNPSRWATAFAELTSERDDVDARSKAITELLAARIEVNIAPDAPWERGIRPGALLRAFDCDPRVDGGDAPTVLAIHRDDDDHVRTSPLDRDAVAAWGLESGEADRALLATAGIDDAALERGRARLLTVGVLRG
ncbi:MAG: hypothetical protein M3Y87_10625 [Myxococcota bacterium]|nr:hypothetical protein [Myxococcota bacterium]